MTEKFLFIFLKILQFYEICKWTIMAINHKIIQVISIKYILMHLNIIKYDVFCKQLFHL